MRRIGTDQECYGDGFKYTIREYVFSPPEIEMEIDGRHALNFYTKREL